MYYAPYYANIPMYSYGNQSVHWPVPYEVVLPNSAYPYQAVNGNNSQMSTDYGQQPFVVNMEEATKRNNTYRTALWTGSHLQITLMSLNIGEDVGLEMHPHVDQFVYIEQGHGTVQMGSSKENLSFTQNVQDDYAIVIPAGTWHNLTNIGNVPLKLFSIYAPPNHPFGTVHATKADAMASHGGYGQHN
ncbi:cupin domain-containing protein [Lysinibacillus tabacifolii]|uniref:Cupin domain-containing protein n=1 Tax=Lysinibacillus tabacifolii TaxID=1173107 RepID=A0ABY2SVK0_9BACI|nr:cupin domain-containing protein [Lysinibacillus tabacifolii]TKI46615.1 cupin domain-containing protein [Lysinibacillus tabacifolii]